MESPPWLSESGRTGSYGSPAPDQLGHFRQRSRNVLKRPALGLDAEEASDQPPVHITVGPTWYPTAGALV